VARPLHELDKKGIPWKWEGEQQRAFDTLKDLILNEPCLAHADLDKTFRMQTDALAYAYGAALSQKQNDRKFHPVAFMSKSMLPAEQNYDAYDREALGIIKPLQHWQYWLQGTKKPIEVITNHKNLLSGFNNTPTPSKQHLHWLESLKGFDCLYYHTPGAKNTVADILSRRTDHYPEEEEKPGFNPFPENKMFPIEQLEISAMEFGLDQEEMMEALEWAYLCAINSDATIMEEIRLVVTEMDLKGENGKIWVPNINDLRHCLLELYHDTPIPGHLGIGGTYELPFSSSSDYFSQSLLGMTIVTQIITARVQSFLSLEVLLTMPDKTFLGRGESILWHKPILVPTMLPASAKRNKTL